MQHRSSRSSPYLELPADEEIEEAQWLDERRDAERQASLIQRIDQLANDAKIERLEAAASLLRTTAEELRSALKRDQAKNRSGR